MEYVCGFLIHRPLMLVALVKKQKPAWQAGLLNGIGGKIEARCRCGHLADRHQMQGTACNDCFLLSNMMKPEAQCRCYVFERMETPLEAMRREFREEIGVDRANWHHYVTMAGKMVRGTVQDEVMAQAYTCHFLRGFCETYQYMNDLRTKESEEITLQSIHHVDANIAIPNLPWLIRLALDIDQDIVNQFTIVEQCYRK